MGWKGSPHLERTPRSVAAAPSEVSPRPTRCRAHCLAFNSFSNLYLEQLLTDYSQNNPRCHFFQLTNPEYCYPPHQPLVPGSPGRNVTQRELAEDLGESLVAPARSWAADCEFPPPSLHSSSLQNWAGTARQPAAALPRNAPGSPSERWEDFPRSWGSWRADVEGKETGSWSACLSLSCCGQKKMGTGEISLAKT